MEPLNRSLVVRADAHSGIGTGHVMRCFALAQEWQRRGGNVTFAGYCDSRAVRQRLESAGMAHVALPLDPHAEATVERLLELLAAETTAQPIVVLDGYDFGAELHSAIRAAGDPLLVVDDTAHLPYYDASILLNQNVGADALKYRCASETVRLLGPQYVLLRDDFRGWPAHAQREDAETFHVLVTMGGSDPINATAKVARALTSLPAGSIEARIVMGPASTHLEAVRSVLEDRRGIEIVSNPGSMPELMAWADLAITAGGSTCYEIAYMGLPNIILTIADNQRGIAAGLDALGIADHLGDAEAVTFEDIAASIEALRNAVNRRKEMSDRGRRLIDGDGAARVVDAIIELVDGVE